MLQLADAVADSINSTTLTADQLGRGMTDEKQRAVLLALSDRAYSRTKET